MKADTPSGADLQKYQGSFREIFGIRSEFQYTDNLKLCSTSRSFWRRLQAVTMLRRLEFNRKTLQAVAQTEDLSILGRIRNN